MLINDRRNLMDYHTPYHSPSLFIFIQMEWKSSVILVQCYLVHIHDAGDDDENECYEI
jgi:hypothetical protein